MKLNIPKGTTEITTDFVYKLLIELEPEKRAEITENMVKQAVSDGRICSAEKEENTFNNLIVEIQRQRVTEVIIPYGVTKIEDSAFACFQNLESVEFPDTLVYIGDCAFYECNRLKKCILPQKLESVGDYAFFNTSIEKIRFSPNIVHLGENAFYPCPLKQVDLPIAYIKDVLWECCGILPETTYFFY